jgi:hypothetical protein
MTANSSQDAWIAELINDDLNEALDWIKEHPKLKRSGPISRSYCNVDYEYGKNNGGWVKASFEYQRKHGERIQVRRFCCHGQ